MTTGHGRFIWYDLTTTDTEAAASFYENVIGWKATDSGMTHQTYTLLSMGPDMIAGLMATPPDMAAAGVPPCWTGHIAVDDVDDYAEKVVSAGGAIRRPPEDIPGIGRFSVVSDPQGVVFILFKGTGTPPAVPAAGTPGYIGWCELHAGDLETAWAFYTGLFGWTSAGEVDMGPAGAYRMFATGGEMPVGGMMTKMPETRGPFWLYYFNVEAVDAAVERATKAGGKLLMGPHQVPGGQWIAQMLDPQGAIFAVVAFTR